jgi:hypothetical protein
MDVWLCTNLLKGPVVSKHVIAKLESDWKHLLDVPTNVGCPILENY